MKATILLADYANYTQDGKLMVVGLFSQINATGFPVRHSSMYLVISLQDDSVGSPGGKKQLRTRLLDADGSTMWQVEGPFEIAPWREGPRPEVNFIFSLNNIEFREPGDYRFDVDVDDELVGEVAVYLNRIQIDR